MKPYVYHKSVLFLKPGPQMLHSCSQEWQENEDEEPHAGKGRNCLTVCCGVSGMMLATNILMLVTLVYVLVIVQSATNPLIRDLS